MAGFRRLVPNTRRIGVRMTDAEFRMVSDLTTAYGLRSAADAIRRAIREALAKERRRAKDPAAVQ